MINKEDIKVGSFLKIKKFDLEAIAGPNFAEETNQHCSLNTCVVKVVNMTEGMCEIQYSFWCIPAVVDTEGLAKVAISSSAKKTANRKTDADRFKEITEKMNNIYKCKNSDYGNSFSKLFKKCGMTYAYGHLAEKIERIDNLRNKDAKVQGERVCLIVFMTWLTTLSLPSWKSKNVRNMVQTDYTCKDCFFFKDGVCHHPTVNMFTSEGDPSCKHFEYKEIKVEL